MNYYERHIGDYLKDTAHLSLLEHGIYTRLLDVYYTREAGIPIESCARLVGVKSKDERAALGVVLDEFFVVDGDMLKQARCDLEIARYQDKQRKAKASAAASWESRRATQSHSERIANAMRTHSDGNAPSLQTPVTSKEKEKEPRKRDAPPTRPDDVGELTWLDWLKLRKGKRAAVSETVIAEARKEAAKAGMPLERFLSVWCARGSQGLEADWLKPHERGSPMSFRERDTAAATARVIEMTGGLLDASRPPLDPLNTIEMETPRVAQIRNR